MDVEMVPFSVTAVKSFLELGFENVTREFQGRNFSDRMKITEESLLVGDVLAEMLKQNKIMEVLEYQPHVVSDSISAADLRTAKHLREKISNAGRKFYYKRGSTTEFSGYIDRAIGHVIDKNQGATDFSTVSDTLRVDLPIFPEWVSGRPDAMWKHHPVEIKTAPSISAFVDDRSRQSGGLNQLALYQMGLDNVSGFLVVVCRETGSIACFEATIQNMSIALNKWRAWMTPFSRTSESMLEKISMGANPVSARSQLDNMMFKQLNGIPRTDAEISWFNKLTRLFALLDSKSGSELTDKERNELIEEHEKWLSHMFEMAMD